jgi:hypothetical protein
MLDRTQPRDWATITNGELAKLSPHEQRQFQTWLLNQWSNQAWSRAQNSFQADHDDAIRNQDWTRG